MADMYCPDCAHVSGGCWRHNGSGTYTFVNGQLVQVQSPVRYATQFGWVQILAPPLPSELKERGK